MEFKRNSAPLEEVIEKFIDYRGKTPKKTSYGIPLITAKIIKEGFIQEVKEFIAEEDYEVWMRRGFPRENDVVLTTEAPLGEVALINTDKKIALAQRVITLRGKENVMDNVFLKYSLQGTVMQARLRERESGSTVTGIKSSELKKVIIDFPNIEIQKRIGAMLKSLDDKISINKKMIFNLEQIAQTVFQHWFIDFEFQNEDGQPYKSSGGKMVESEIGSVPVEWQVGKASDIFHFSPKTTLKKGNVVDYIEMKDLNDSAVIHSWKKRAFGGSGSKFVNGDTLLARITPCLENGKIGYVDFMEKDKVGWGSTEFIAIRSKEGYPNTLTYFFASNPDFKNYAISNMNGSSGRQRVNHQTLGNYPCVVYPKEITQKFAEIADEIMGMISNLRNEINTLINTRDTLLPKLLSGEIELPDETEVTEHVPIQ